MWFLVAAALASEWEVDLSSLDPPGSWPEAVSERCPQPTGSEPTVRGRALHTLGVAAVVYSRKQATMAWGHASLRAVYCLDRELVDVEFESYRLSGWNEEQLRAEHEGEDFVQGDWLKTQRGSLILFRNVDPVGRGWYAEAQRKNREIYELWVDSPQADLDALVVEADGWYHEQLEALRARQDLPGRYRALSTNCTQVLRRLLPEALAGDRPHLPFAWLRQLEPVAVRRTLHPSLHLVRGWQPTVPDQVARRPRPVFRRGAEHG